MKCGGWKQPSGESWGSPRPPLRQPEALPARAALQPLSVDGRPKLALLPKIIRPLLRSIGDLGIKFSLERTRFACDNTLERTEEPGFVTSFAIKLVSVHCVI